MRLGLGTLGDRGWQGRDYVDGKIPLYSSHYDYIYIWNTVAGNKVWATPFMVARLFPVKTMMISAYGYVSGPIGVNVGIYQDNGSKYPGKLIYVGNISVNQSAYFGHYPSANVFLSPGKLYWLAVQKQNTGNAQFGPNGIIPSAILGLDLSGTMNHGDPVKGFYAYEIAQTYSAGSLPDPYDAGATRVTNKENFFTLWVSPLTV